jgi:hypothetical protein
MRRGITDKRCDSERGVSVNRQFVNIRHVLPFIYGNVAFFARSLVMLCNLKLCIVDKQAEFLLCGNKRDMCPLSQLVLSASSSFRTASNPRSSSSTSFSFIIFLAPFLLLSPTARRRCGDDIRPHQNVIQHNAMYLSDKVKYLSLTSAAFSQYYNTMKATSKKNQLTFSAEPLIAEQLDRSLAWVINYSLLKGIEATEVVPKARRRGVSGAVIRQFLP